MARVDDVAAYILNKSGSMSSMKLQKLVYYAQAWHLVWDEERLFDEKIQAWANGPVVYELFDKHRGRYMVGPPWRGGDARRLKANEKETIDVVLDHYGRLDGRKLSHLTHSERPWRAARSGLGPTDRSTEEITPAALLAYYGALDADEESSSVDDLDWNEWESAFDTDDER